MGKIRHVIEALISAFLFAFQHVPISIVASFTPMLTPLFLFLFTLHSSKDPARFSRHVNEFLFSERLMFGRIVAISGLIVFLAACVQLAYVQLLRKDEEIVTYGLYSVVRHPQYLGIIGVTLGITIMCRQSFFGGQVTEIWLIQVLGYILLAGYEERHLMKEHEEEYQSYKEKVAFIFPIPDVPKIPEPLVSLAVAYFVMVLLTLV